MLDSMCLSLLPRSQINSMASKTQDFVAFCRTGEVWNQSQYILKGKIRYVWRIFGRHMVTYRTVVSPPVSSSNCAFPCFYACFQMFRAQPATSPRYQAPWMTCCWAPWGHPGGESGRAGTSRRQWPSPWPEAFFTTMTTTTMTTTTARPHIFFMMSPTIMVYRRYLVHTCTHHVHFFALALWNPSSLVTQAILAALWFLLRGSTRFTESEHSNLSAPKIQMIVFGCFGRFDP